MSHFNQIANEWDSEEKIKMMHELASQTMAHLNIVDKIDILDFGCGTGLFGLEFEQHIKSLTGIDTSEGMLQVFNQKTINSNNIKSINIDLEHESIDEHFDLIISSMAFHHLDDPLSVLKKLRRNLKDNGQIAIVDLDKEDGSFHPDNEAMGVKHFGFSKEDLCDWAQKANLSLNHNFINAIEKNNHSYKQFLAIFS